ncbi:MAG: hypothetical protein KIT31_24965 [Deltaproteobacteria bacterium]|nr:hypothetical protein [Deltaproteobacteria bacterium]
MRTVLVVAAVVLAALGGAGCSKKKEPPACAAIVDKMMGLIKGQLGGEMGDKAGMIATCEKSFTDDMKRCLGDAADLDAVAVCRGGKPKPRARVPEPPPERPPPRDPHEGLDIKKP